MPTTRNKDGSKSHAKDPENCATCNIDFQARRRYGKERYHLRYCSPSCYNNRTSKPHNWEPFGTKKLSKRGYVLVKLSESVWRHEHVVIAEKVLGRRLKRAEVVHHVNGIGHDNTHTAERMNLVICTAGYHNTLHEKMSRIYQQSHFINRQ